MAAVAELNHEDTDNGIELPSWMGPVSEAALQDLCRAIDEGAVSTLSDMMSLIGAAKVGYDSAPAPETNNRRYDFSDQEEQFFSSVTLESTALERLRNRLAQDDDVTGESLVASAFEDAYQESKEQEAGRMVPFGVRLSCHPTAVRQVVEPSMFLISFTRTRIIWIDDGPYNDDYPA